MMNKKFYSVTYFGKIGPAQLGQEVSYIYCKDEAEQASVVKSFEFHFPEFPPLVGEVDRNSDPKSIPFISSETMPIKHERFFKVTGWKSPKKPGSQHEPVLEPMKAKEWFNVFNKVTGLTVDPAADLYAASIGKLGGLSTSAAKAKAAKKNGKLGGRPPNKK